MRPTDIEWCDYSANPIKLRLRESGKLVNACVKCSPGCGGCYAESIVRHWWRKDWGKFPGYSAALMKLGDIVVDERELKAMLRFKPKGPFKHGAKRPSVFVQDMGDLFGPWVGFELLDRCFAAFALRPDVDWLVLTKRIERAAEYLAFDGHQQAPEARAEGCTCRKCRIASEAAKLLVGRGVEEMDAHIDIALNVWNRNWPFPNIWLGTSVEDQQRADERIPQLLRCPAAVRFLSCEPLIGPVDLNLGSILLGNKEGQANINGNVVRLPGIDWVIAGAESGAGARPMHPDWARGLRDQCERAGVPFFFKQWGEWKPISEIADADTSLYKSNRIADEEWRQADVDEVYGRRCTVATTMLRFDGQTGLGAQLIDGHLAYQVFRVRKENAGRLLDGREWNQRPGMEEGAKPQAAHSTRVARSGREAVHG